MAEGAMRGETLEQYPGGPATRQAGIDWAHGQPAAALAARLVAAVDWLHSTWEAMPAEAWSVEVGLTAGNLAAADAVALRWLEVEVHHCDLGLSRSWKDWPEPFVSRQLEPVLRRLVLRAQEPPNGNVVLWADDRNQAWFLRASGGLATVEAFHGGDADAMVRGPGGALLAWVLGRGDDGLTVTGDRELLPGLLRAISYGPPPLNH
jgi:maleylpyruvate isomerase